ncbi:hypothetical protein [Parabacteroides distasonis]|uniref:hypothetical protein n=1 Tax=Parabacteroides distasonis TaxID=823 RepID=UPI00321B4EEE
MPIIDLGRITYVNKKEWTSTTPYESKDVVSYNGSSWASLSDNNVNNIPSEGTYWTLMSKSTYQSWLDQGNSGTEEDFIASITQVQPDWNQTNTSAKDYIKNKPSKFTPDAHTHTKSQISDFPSSLPADGGNSSTVNGHTVNSDVPSNAKFTDTIFDDSVLRQQISDTLNASKQYTNEQIGKIVGFDISVVSTLPSIGQKGIIYLVPKSDGRNTDFHNEYIWIDDKYELIGNTAIDLSAYSTTEQNDNKYVPKEVGKGLSTNDYTNEEKTKLSSIAANAEVNVNADWNATTGSAQILNKPNVILEQDIDQTSIDKSQSKWAVTGTTNKNTISSTNRVYDWVGTQSEYDTQFSTGEIDPSWICFITDVNPFSGFNIWIGTIEEYGSIIPHDTNTIYLIKD